MKSRIIIPEIFKPLFLPNHTAAQREAFTKEYKAEIKRKLLRGEEISDEMLGVKTIVLKGGRISGRSEERRVGKECP